jgi:hypothetical protein
MGDPVQSEVDVLDQRVLRDDEAVDDRGVVLDRLCEAATFELGEEATLAELREPH